MMESNNLWRIPEGSDDANLQANQRFLGDPSPNKVNLAIGTNADAEGNPFGQATTYVNVLQSLVSELGVNCGKYIPTSKISERARPFILQILGLEEIAERCVVSFASDGGTGGLVAALQFIFGQNSTCSRVFNVQEDSWPGYGSIAMSLGAKCEKVAIGAIESQAPTVWQIIHNGSGLIYGEDVWGARANFAAHRGIPQVLDIPYHRFEEASGHSPERSMVPIKAMVNAGTPLVMVFSPTKVYNTFSYRPGGVVVIVCRSAQERKRAEAFLGRVLRGRGCAFGNIATIALASTMLVKPDGLNNDHQLIIERLRQATNDWKQWAGGKLAPFFGPDFAGLFRILLTVADAIETLVKQHIHVVDASTPDSGPRIRINCAGLPHARAQEIVTAVEAVMR